MTQTDITDTVIHNTDMTSLTQTLLTKIFLTNPIEAEYYKVHPRRAVL